MQKVILSDEVRGRTPCCAQTVYGSHVNVIYIYICIHVCHYEMFSCGCEDRIRLVTESAQMCLVP